MNARKILILVAYFLTTLLAVATASSYYYTPDKRAQDRPFMMSSRYGRANGGSGNGKHVVVAPRTDKFFLASRYGKRSDLSPRASLVYPVSTPFCGNDEDLSCAYTGFSNLYRCAQRKDSTSAEVSSSQ